MFDYPARAEENRTIPKSKIYEFAEPGRGVRKRFVEEVEDIVWLYTLAPETINLPARPGVDEIKIFSITLKTDKVSGDVLRTIDKAIPSPLFFELRSGDVVKFTAAYKRPSDADTSKTVVDDYFETDWQPAGKPRLPLPLALDLGGLYGQMLQAHAGVPLRPRRTSEGLRRTSHPNPHQGNGMQTLRNSATAGDTVQP